MKPATLSASSIKVFETCAARWRAEYLDFKRAGSSGSAADLGTTCHEALELWVRDDHYVADYDKAEAVAVMTELYRACYWQHFSDERRFGEGLTMCLNWQSRQDWSGRTVISTEKKDTLELPTSAGSIPFNYIWDRCDRLDNGDIEIVDYKSWMVPRQPDDMQHDVQVRLYALSAQLQFPDAARIWVILDQLRYDAVGVVYSKEENRAAWRYLKAAAERIIDSDGTTETLNEDCRYCLRKHQCSALARHAAAGGPLSITDPVQAADRRAELQAAQKAIEAMVAELDSVIVGHLEAEEISGFDTERNHVELATQNKRIPPDKLMLTRVIGPELAATMGKPTLAEIDELKRSGKLTPAQSREIDALIRRTVGSRGIRVKALGPVS